MFGRDDGRQALPRVRNEYRGKGYYENCEKA